MKPNEEDAADTGPLWLLWQLCQ